MPRQSTWANIGQAAGNNLINGLPAEMCFEVNKQPLKYGEENLLLEGYSTVVNASTGRAYGPVSNKYNPISNKDAFDFIQYIEGFELDKWGETKNGTQWLIGHLPDVEVLGDRFTPHLVGRNSFDGSCPLQMTIAPLRIVCQNQITLAMRETNNSINVSHTKSADEKLKMGTALLRREADYMSWLTAEAEKYANQRVDQNQLNDIVNYLFPHPGEDVKDFIVERWESKVNAFKSAYLTADNNNFRGTAWGIINAYSDYLTHQESGRKTAQAEENRFLIVTFDPRAMAALTRLLKDRVAV